MVGTEETFGLLAELAIALAGFAGVSAAFAGRERAYRPTERLRLESLFLNSGMILSGCGGVIVLLMAEVAPTPTFRIVSLLIGAVFASRGAWGIVQAYRRARDSDSTSEPWALRLNSTYVIATSALLAANVLVGSAYLLATAFWVLLIYGLWMFFRVLTRSN